MTHSHSKWEPCNGSCPVYWRRVDVWEGRLEAHFPDSVKRDIVISGVVFKP